MNWDEEIDEDVDYKEVDVLDEFPKKRTRRVKDGKETQEYVSKEEMWNELHAYYVSLGDNYDWEAQRIINKDVFPTISPRLTTIISDIATKMGYRANFCSYSWLEEMIGDATLKMFKTVRDGSFNCYAVAEIVTIIKQDDGSNIITFLDKNGELQKKVQEDSDEFLSENMVFRDERKRLQKYLKSEFDKNLYDTKKKYVYFNANAFGYFSRTTTHSYLNRIKKEKTMEETKRAYQSDTWEKLYSNENFRNVRRPKYSDSDENDQFLD
jgi:hypothetical protein